jgi:hypothetical protein
MNVIDMNRLVPARHRRLDFFHRILCHLRHLLLLLSGGRSAPLRSPQAGPHGGPGYGAISWWHPLALDLHHVRQMRKCVPGRGGHRGYRSPDPLPARTGRRCRASCTRGWRPPWKPATTCACPPEDYTFILEDVAEELAEEPGFESFTAPIDVKGARILSTIHNKLVNTHTDDLKHWWKIFHVPGESWTMTSQNWEGTSWGYFTGDDDAMKVMAGRIYEQMQRLEVETLMWPE